MCVSVCVLVWWLLSKRLLQVKGLRATGGLSMGLGWIWLRGGVRGMQDMGDGVGLGWLGLASRVAAHTALGKAKNVT